MDTTDILTMTDIADLAGKTRGTIGSLKAKGYLPDPDGVIAGQPVWHRSTVTAWLANRPGYGGKLGPVPQGTEEAKAACEGWVSAPELADRLGIPAPTFRDWVKAGKFPQPVGRVGRAAVWREADLPSRLSAE